MPRTPKTLQRFLVFSISLVLAGLGLSALPGSALPAQAAIPCTPGGPPSIYPSPVITPSAEAGSRKVQIGVCKGSWRANISDQSWLSLERNEGSATADQVTLSWKANTNSSTGRTSTVTISASGSIATATLVVIQQPAYTLDFDYATTWYPQATWDADFQAPKRQVKVTIGKPEPLLMGNTSWSASSDQPWLKVSPSSGRSGATMTFTVDQNPEAVSRTGRITVKVPGRERKLEVTQSAARS